jgi:hypothetical protein
MISLEFFIGSSFLKHGFFIEEFVSIVAVVFLSGIKLIFKFRSCL